MSFFKKKIWLIFIIIIAVTIGIAYISRSGDNPAANAVNFVLTPIESKLNQWIVRPVDEFISYIANMKEFKEENERLKVENQELSAKVKDISEYIAENDRLKKLLEIDNELTEYTTVAAKVAAYEPDNWFSYITIDKGSSSGIKESDPVITAQGLLGQVTDVGRNWAKISTIINSESSVGVRITRNGEIGILEGDVKLSKSNKSKLAYLVSNASIISGDILETSGLGGIYPPGLMVGKITEMQKNNMGQLDYAIVEPFVDFNNLYEVLVITQWSLDSDVYQDENINNHDDYLNDYNTENNDNSGLEDIEYRNDTVYENVG